MGQPQRQNTVSRRPSPVWAWEGLRRNPAYRRDYHAHRHGLPTRLPLYGGSHLLRAQRRCRVAEHYGLLALADPNQSAFDAPIFWHPDRLAGALRVKLTPIARAETASDNAPDHILLSDLKTRRLLFETVDGRRHILLNGQRFWIQLYAIDPAPLGDDAAIDIRFDGVDQMKRRLDTAAQLLALHRAAGGKLSLIGRRKNTRALGNALKAYDIIHGFERPAGTLEEVAAMIVGRTRMEADWGRDDRAVKAQARRAIAKGERFVADGYQQLLSRKVL